MNTSTQRYGTSLPYEITQSYLPPDTSERAPPIPSQIGWYSINLPRRDGRLSWPNAEIAITTALTIPIRISVPSKRQPLISDDWRSYRIHDINYLLYFTYLLTFCPSQNTEVFLKDKICIISHLSSTNAIVLLINYAAYSTTVPYPSAVLRYEYLYESSVWGTLDFCSLSTDCWDNVSLLEDAADNAALESFFNTTVNKNFTMTQRNHRHDPHL